MYAVRKESEDSDFTKKKRTVCFFSFCPSTHQSHTITQKIQMKH